MEQPSTLRHIRKALGDLGFTQIEDGPQTIDLIARRGRGRFAIEAKTVSPFRARDLHARAALAVIQLEKYAKGISGLIAIEIPKITPRAVAAMTEFMDEFASSRPWLLVDSTGGSVFKNGEEYREVPGTRAPTDRMKTPKRLDPFSPKNQWALKTLLLGGIDNKYFGASEQFDPPPLSTQALAERVPLAWSHAWNLVQTLRRLDYVAPVPEVRFVDCRKLLEDWAQSCRVRPEAMTLAKPLFSETREALYGRLATAVTGPDRRSVLVGSFEACRLLGLSKTSIEYMRAYIEESPSSFMKAYDLIPAEPREAWVELVFPRDLSSLKAASALAKAGDRSVWVTDIIQTFLDVRHSPTRGIEQANFLYDRVLEPHFRSRGWD